MKGNGAGPESAFEGAIGGEILQCPAHAPFLPTLAAAVLGGAIWNRGRPAPHELPELTIYVPARAAVEPLKLAFLAASPNAATFLPRIHVLGDTDPLALLPTYGPRMANTAEALGLFEEALAIPPAFDDLERQIELAALVLDAARTLKSKRVSPGEPLFAAMPAASAYTVAGEIASLIDEADSDAADLARIEQLDSSLASGSEQLSLQLLRAVWRGWQARKATAGKTGREERRNRLMAVEAEFIAKSNAPIIIAGSTGSVAATMALMEAALSRPHSAVVLHGLDTGLDAESWALIGGHPEHPQHGLHHLLAEFKVERGDIRSLTPHPFLPPPPSSGEKQRPRGGLDTPLRAKFLSEAMRPASATQKWAGYLQSIKGAAPVQGLSLLEADTIQDEAAAIALILRESLETPGQTAALVTPSESLLNRVRHSLVRWGLGADAQGDPKVADLFAARVASCAASGKPEEFVELLRQAAAKAPKLGSQMTPAPLSHEEERWGKGEYKSAQIRRFAEIIDLGVLRQMWRPSSLAGISAALSRAQHAVSGGEARHPAMRRIDAGEWDAARAFASAIVDALSPLTAKAGTVLPLADWVSVHLEALSRFARCAQLDAPSADADAFVLDALGRTANRPLRLDLASYAGLFSEISASRRKLRLENPHPRLFFWTPLDARLLTADVLVLGGLNEGCWPQTPGPNPWLNRRGRTFVGLAPQERRTGQAAHDFATLAVSAPKVILTRSKKINGSLARPSRWVSRITALAGGAGQADSLKPESPWLAWTGAHRRSQNAAPINRPQPKPPLAARPRRLSVTAIETWFANPYAIYARHILGLDPLRRLDETSDARDKGILYHAALHNFFQAYPNALPPNAPEELLKKLDKAAAELGFNLENAPFWRPRFARFAAWFAESETGRRADVNGLKSEVSGKLRLDAPAGPFEITARADRIDRLSDGSIRIYDFKTSANTAKVSAARGAPQLALEGLLAKEGAFAGIPAGSAAELFYIVATGGEPPGEIVTLKIPCAEAIEAATEGVKKQIARFDEEATPYAYEMRVIFRDKAENDPYAHLARVQEWSVEAEEAEAGDD